jgi:hypothetical protein
MRRTHFIRATGDHWVRCFRCGEHLPARHAYIAADSIMMFGRHYCRSCEEVLDERERIEFQNRRVEIMR